MLFLFFSLDAGVNLVPNPGSFTLNNQYLGEYTDSSPITFTVSYTEAGNICGTPATSPCPCQVQGTNVWTLDAFLTRQAIPNTNLATAISGTGYGLKYTRVADVTPTLSTGNDLILILFSFTPILLLNRKYIFTKTKPAH